MIAVLNLKRGVMMMMMTDMLPYIIWRKSILIAYKSGGLNDIKVADPVIEGPIRGLIVKTMHRQIKRSKRKEAIVGEPLGKIVVLKEVGRNRMQNKK